MRRPTSRHTFEGHTSEVAIRIQAPTLGELYAEAGRALAHLMLGDDVSPDGPPLVETVHETVAVEARDPVALMVDWLNELIFRGEVAKVVFTRITVTAIDERHLAAEIAGVLEPPLKTAVKAATFHDLVIACTDQGCEARVVLDV